jgi:hypothetical protein
MDLQQFLSRPSGSFSRAFNSRHYNQDLSDEVRELAHRGCVRQPHSQNLLLYEFVAYEQGWLDACGIAPYTSEMRQCYDAVFFYMAWLACNWRSIML